MSAIFDEVVRPDMVWILGPQPDARSVIEPESSSLQLLMWNLQPLPPPDPLDAFEVDDPAGFPQQRRDPAIAVAAVTGREFDNVGSQRRFVVRRLGNLALRRSIWLRTRHANRSETPNVSMARSTQMRRRAGLTSFPKRPLSGSVSQASDPTPHCANAHSPSRAP